MLQCSNKLPKSRPEKNQNGFSYILKTHAIIQQLFLLLEGEEVMLYEKV